MRGIADLIKRVGKPGEIMDRVVDMDVVDGRLLGIPMRGYSQHRARAGQRRAQALQECPRRTGIEGKGRRAMRHENARKHASDMARRRGGIKLFDFSAEGARQAVYWLKRRVRSG